MRYWAKSYPDDTSSLLLPSLFSLASQLLSTVALGEGAARAPDGPGRACSRPPPPSPARSRWEPLARPPALRLAGWALSPGSAAWHAAAARSKRARVASVSRREQRLAREGSINANYQL